MRPASIFSLLAQNPPDDAPVALPGVYDALSARLAERAGFRALFLSGFGVSAARLGRPDFGFVGRAEMLDAARQVCAAVSVPVIVDVDTGWGGVFNVEEVVAELVRIGAAGCFLEDQVFPKRCGHMRGKRVVPLDEYLPKVNAALRARRGAPFHVTARTDARAASGLDEALFRAQAFADAGADAVFVEAPESVDEMARIRAAVPKATTLVANMVEGGRTPIRDVAALGAAGYRLVVQPVTGILAAAHALQTAYAALARDGGSAAIADRLLGFDALNGVLGLDELYAREAQLAVE